MKLVNAVQIAIFFALTGCSVDSVSESDKAEAALNQGDVAAAQIHIRNALQGDATNQAMVFLNARIALEAGNPEMAKTELRKLLDDPQYAPRAAPLLAKALLMLGQGREALQVLGDDKPASDLAYAGAVSAHLLQGQSDRANALLDEGLAAFPKSPDLLVLDGTRALQNGNRILAQAQAARAVKLAPKDINALLFAGRVAMLQRKLPEAVRQFDAVLALRPQHQTALLGKAAIAYDQGKTAEARSMLQSASDQLGGGSKPINFFLAQLAFDAGDSDKANQLLQGMSDLKDFPAAGMLAGLVAAKRGQNEQAIALLRRFLSAGGEDGRARFTLASTLQKVGLSKEAWSVLQPLADAANANGATLQLATQLTQSLSLPSFAAYQARAAALAQGDPLARDMLEADKAIRGGDWARAEAIYATLLRAHPATTNIILLNNAASVLIEQERAAEAIPLARRAIALAPKDPIVLDTLGWALFKSGGSLAEARSLVQKAAQTMPGNREISEHVLATSNAKMTAQ